MTETQAPPDARRWWALALHRRRQPHRQHRDRRRVHPRLRRGGDRRVGRCRRGSASGACRQATGRDGCARALNRSET
jgi:hypothetical protein